MTARKRSFVVVGAALASSCASAQVPDLLNALDAGGRAMGVGGATQATDSNTLSGYYNPAGLAFITAPTIAAAVRNLPESDNRISGNFNNPDYSTSRGMGARRLTHVGAAFPVKNGVVGLSYTVGGSFKDFRLGDNLADGALTVRNYQEVLQAQTDFFSLSFGARRQDLNWGVGLVVANQYISDQGRYDQFDGNNNVGSVTISNSGNTTGIGAIAGVQFSPGHDGKSQVGISVRTPIRLSKNTQTDPYLNKLPGRASIGVATRTDPMRGGKDFLVYGAQLDWFFGADKNGTLQRKDVLSGGAGVEYNLHRYNARIPLRLGYSFVPKGGDAFIARNTFTFGIGYRPESSNLAVDLNFGLPSGGGAYDMGLSVTYRVGK
ncbi:MAG: hypothetical protein JST30_09305 [Armatimonadetes bacterium]|nr:hypothetical protein [Armatimonadota bacterium]